MCYMCCRLCFKEKDKEIINLKFKLDKNHEVSAAKNISEIVLDGNKNICPEVKEPVEDKESSKHLVINNKRLKVTIKL